MAKYKVVNENAMICIKIQMLFSAKIHGLLKYIFAIFRD